MPLLAKKCVVFFPVCVIFMIFLVYFYITNLKTIADTINMHLYQTNISNLGNINLNGGFKLTSMINKQNKQNKCFHLYWNTSDTYEYIDGLLSRMDHNNNATGICSRFLTIQSAFDRMGNQMFQLAALFGLACEYDYIPIVPASQTFIKKYFILPNMFDKTIILPYSRGVECIGDKFGVHYDCSKELNSTFSNGVKTISGKFLQSWKYFHSCQQEIRQIFRFRKEYVDNARKFMKEVSLNGSTNICIHVRRGDALNELQQKLGRTVVNETDIRRAQQYYLKHFRQVTFIVLSDDIEWCKSTIRGNAVFSPFTDPGDDMALIMLCDHVIVSSGTFGWWGAWLSGGTTLYLEDFPRKNSTFDQDMNRGDYYPPDWIPY